MTVDLVRGRARGQGGGMGHPVFARVYDRWVVPALREQGMDDLRSRMLAGLRGTVVEVGAGEGSNFALYPAPVTRVVAVEPEPYLRRRARARSQVEGVQVVGGDAVALPVGDDTADALVFCLVLCTVPVEAALTEARRVLRPGGEVRFLEHVADPEPGPRRRRQARLDVLRPRLAGGCHLGRDTVAALGCAGFAVTALERIVFPAGSRALSAPMVLGRAVPAPA